MCICCLLQGGLGPHERRKAPRERSSGAAAAGAATGGARLATDPQVLQSVMPQLALRRAPLQEEMRRSRNYSSTPYMRKENMILMILLNQLAG